MDDSQELHDEQDKEIQQRIEKLSQSAADQFVLSNRDHLDVMSLYKIYQRGYRDAIMDVVIRGRTSI